MERRLDHILDICRNISRRRGVHSVIAMQVAGFVYTNVGDTVRCNDCRLEVSGWTEAMIPFTIHAERSPNCSFVHFIRASNQSVALSSLTSPITCLNRVNRESTCENISENKKLDGIEVKLHPHMFAKPDKVEQSRRRTFSRATFQCTSCREQMIKAGFFSCNIGDRVICLDCNLICHQWILHSDDPCEVHQTLSPECPIVKNMRIPSQAASPSIVNANSTTNHTAGAVVVDTFRSNGIVPIVPQNLGYVDIPTRSASYATWTNGTLPTVEKFVEAGFFYTGNGSIVTCFYCRGSLQGWNADHNPMIEHARSFPHCAYAKQLCGDDLHRTIQESTRDGQRLTRTNNSTTSNTFDDQQLHITDENMLTDLINARLRLSMSQKLLAQGFPLSIIKLYWKNQLKLKILEVVLESECDLQVACIILQRQMIHIDRRKEQIIIPAEGMRQIHEKQQQSRTRAATVQIPVQETALPTNALNATDIGMNVIPEPSMNQAIPRELMPANLCMFCLSEERRLALMPCGHMGTCLACSRSFNSCHICGRMIKTFIRIYIS
ncbi:unnamed protein product [Rotaria sp. Silwood2]|nr:unnamed protein product [Rotaria sp. Silwood2]CAF4185885.1 unnamed protein product [Rotaria sp. Silwood2]